MAWPHGAAQVARARLQLRLRLAQPPLGDGALDQPRRRLGAQRVRRLRRLKRGRGAGRVARAQPLAAELGRLKGGGVEEVFV